MQIHRRWKDAITQANLLARRTGYRCVVSRTAYGWTVALDPGDSQTLTSGPACQGFGPGYALSKPSRQQF